MNLITSHYLCILIAAASISAAGSREMHASGRDGNPQTQAQEYLMDTESQEWFSGATAAVLAVKVSGDTVACLNSQKMLIPASTMKSITTGLAMHALGPDYRFETRIGYSGEISSGTLHGDLYIMGGGDPTLGSGNRIAETAEKTFARWKAMLDKAGISTIEGRIIGDGRFFDDAAEIDSWQWNDIGTYYGTGVSGLSFYENRQNITFTPSDTPGKPLEASVGYPQTPWMEYRFSCTTGKPGTGNTLYLFTSPFAPEGEMRGTLAIDRGPRTEQVSNKFPAYTCASYFRDWLEAEGISCRGGAADCGYFSRPGGQKKNAHCPDIPAHPENIGIIGMTGSPVLSRIVFETNHESNNVYAEVLFHTLGKAVTRSAGYDSSRSAAGILLSGLGLDPEEVNIVDGSGLSRQNLLSPSFICGFLEAMTESDEFGSFASSLPSPGSGGTMQAVMQGYDTSLTSRIRLKSGSMNGIKCFSGYVFPVSGEKPAVFSIMINNSLLSQYRMQKIIDRILFLLVSELDRTGQ